MVQQISQMGHKPPVVQRNTKERWLNVTCVYYMRELKDDAPLASHLQSLMTWWMSNSKAASKMLSRGSGTLLESKNMVRHD